MAVVHPIISARRLVCIAIVGLMAGCTPDKPAGAPVAVRSGDQNDASLVFFDADVFDLSFADELKLGTNQVHVTFGGPTPLNAFPPRMNVWLAEVKKSDGAISLSDPAHPGATRGLFGIGLIFDLIDAVNTYRTRQAQAERLALADSYNARIVYDSTNGLAREVLFTRRPPSASALPTPTSPQ